MAFWLKLGYFTAAQEGLSDYWLKRTWVSDGPGRKSPRWSKRQAPSTGETSPPFGPRYEVGDRLVVYVTGHGVCPAVLQVAAEPRWDPEWVDQEGGVGEGDQWGVVTDVRGLWSLDVHAAPKLEQIGVDTASVQRKGHVSLEEWQYRQAEHLIAGKKVDDARGSPGVRQTNVVVPIERRMVEGYEVAPKGVLIQASRREAALVSEFQAHLEAKGDQVSRNRLRPPEAPPLHTDLFNHSRGQLIEAKATGSRYDVRMAIGQLVDYRRFIDDVKGVGVLLGAKPHPDLLDLLDKQGIAAIWRSGDDFLDSADGAFV